MGDNGTLLQDAIQRNKQDFVCILLEYGFVYLAWRPLRPFPRVNFYLFRVDPTAKSDVQPHTPLEIALECYQHLEVLHVLAKFMEMPDDVKHIQLALLVNSEEADEGSNEQFCKIMKSMPLKLVGTFTKYPLIFLPE